MKDASHELVGRTLGGRFRLTGFLGEGAMASVYRGEQDAEPKEVAVKVMHPELLSDDTFAKRFAREARTAARIDHRNTVRILAHGQDGELFYLAMELLVGLDLFDTLARERRLPEARATRIAVQICAALEAAHAHGVVHRDLKPENVMLVRDPANPDADLVKVLDFGIAKILERERPERSDDPPPSSAPVSAPPSSALTRVGSLVGTPDYMSPEQCVGLAIDARSDVYACGVLLFQLVTGKVPFTGGSPMDVMLQHCDKPPPAPSSLVPGIHPRLEKLILGSMAKDAADRPQSARALGDALAALLPELAGSSRRGAAGPGSDPRAADLPGVPGTVVISADKASPRGDALPEGEAPPITMRSPATDLAAALASTIPAPPLGDEEEEAAATTTRRGDASAPPEPGPDDTRPEAAGIARIEARAATRVVKRAPARPDVSPIEDDGSRALWTFGTLTAIVCALLALWRYLRFG